MVSIVVLGSANMDLTVRQPRLPEPGETIFGTSFTPAPGGKGLNQAVAAALGGGDVSFIGAVGTDVFGAQMREALASRGVAVDRLIERGPESGTAHIAVTEDGENAIVVVPAANQLVDTLESADEDLITSAGYLMAQLERPLELCDAAFRVARAAGVTTVLTPAPVRDLSADFLDLVDILVPNAIEARQLAGLDDETAAALALSTGRTVVMTRGSRGVLVARSGEILHDLPARRVDPVDTTGAGDTFAGMLVARLSLGASLAEALTAAGVAASISVTRPGSSSSMPTWDEVAALLG